MTFLWWLSDLFNLFRYSVTSISVIKRSLGKSWCFIHFSSFCHCRERRRGHRKLNPYHHDLDDFIPVKPGYGSCAHHVGKIAKTFVWLVVSTHLKNTSQNGNLPQIGVKIINIWNHLLEKVHMLDLPSHPRMLARHQLDFLHFCRAFICLRCCVGGRSNSNSHDSGHILRKGLLLISSCPSRKKTIWAWKLKNPMQHVQHEWSKIETKNNTYSFKPCYHHAKLLATSHTCRGCKDHHPSPVNAMPSIPKGKK